MKKAIKKRIVISYSIIATFNFFHYVTGSYYIIKTTSIDKKDGKTDTIMTNSSETTRSAFRRGNTKYKASKEDYQWLVGVTDGDGTFYFNHTPQGG